jgi:hypothetical protein
MAMIGLVATTALVMPAASPLHANAEDCAKGAKPHAKGRAADAKPDHNPKYPDANGWYFRDSSKLTVGLAQWWEQMQRKGRLGGEIK